MAQDSVAKKWYYLAEGQAQKQYTGEVTYDGAGFKVQNGMLVD